MPLRSFPMLLIFYGFVIRFNSLTYGVAALRPALYLADPGTIAYLS